MDQSVDIFTNSIIQTNPLPCVCVIFSVTTQTYPLHPKRVWLFFKYIWFFLSSYCCCCCPQDPSLLICEGWLPSEARGVVAIAPRIIVEISLVICLCFVELGGWHNGRGDGLVLIVCA